MPRPQLAMLMSESILVVQVSDENGKEGMEGADVQVWGSESWVPGLSVQG